MGDRIETEKHKPFFFKSNVTVKVRFTNKFVDLRLLMSETRVRIILKLNEFDCAFR